MARIEAASFERFAGACAILTAIASFLYAVAFVILQNVVLSALFLTAVGLLSSAVLVAVYYRVRETNTAFALWALVLGIAGALGSAVHGGYDLANAINPPSSSALAEPRRSAGVAHLRSLWPRAFHRWLADRARSAVSSVRGLPGILVGPSARGVVLRTPDRPGAEQPCNPDTRTAERLRGEPRFVHRTRICPLVGRGRFRRAIQTPEVSA